MAIDRRNTLPASRMTKGFMEPSAKGRHSGETYHTYQARNVQHAERHAWRRFTKNHSTHLTHLGLAWRPCPPHIQKRIPATVNIEEPGSDQTVLSMPSLFLVRGMESGNICTSFYDSYIACFCSIMLAVLCVKSMDSLQTAAFLVVKCDGFYIHLMAALQWYFADRIEVKEPPYPPHLPMHLQCSRTVYCKPDFIFPHGMRGWGTMYPCVSVSL